MNKFEVKAVRFGMNLVNKLLNERVNNVLDLIENKYLFSVKGDKDDIHNLPRTTIRRRLLKYVSREKLRLAVLENLNSKFELRDLNRVRVKNILQKSVHSKYAYALRVGKSMHGQGLYIS